MTWIDDLEEVLRARFAPNDEFNLAAVYESVPELQRLHPENANIEEKIRQTLQQLRDAGRIDFVNNRGVYRFANRTTTQLPERSREALIGAMQGFDASQRQTAAWAKWQENRTYRYAISYDGKLYPVKQIISTATGVPLREIFGGREANSYVEALGFTVVPLRADAPQDGPRYWAIAPGEGARLWRDFLDEGIIAIGWEFLGNLQSFESKAQIGERIKEVKGLDNIPVNDTLACYEFSVEMREGDYVFAKKGRSEIIGVGIIRGPYEYRPGRREYPQVRAVEWKKVGSWVLPTGIRLPLKTLTNVSDYDALIEFMSTVASDGGTTPEIALQAAPVYGIADAMDGLFLEEQDFEGMVDTLARKKNIVIQGPPGVGKTFIARRVAYALMGRADASKVTMIQFHQSYSYEDFIQGWRPSKAGFELRNGVFFDFCRRAQADPNNSYVFVIDEINRGNLSKIFGEIMMLIEVDKRTPQYALPLAYAATENETFFVPPNVFLIGLMNTADRSLAMVDYALRRRFGFVTLRPSFANPRFSHFLLDRGAPQSVVSLIVEKLTRLNAAIAADEKNLGSGFEIGHSFFCPTDNEESLDEAWVRRVINDEIAPLLSEYWFDRPQQATEWIAQLQT